MRTRSRQLALLVNPNASGFDEANLADVQRVLSEAASVETMISERKLHIVDLAAAVSEDTSFDALAVYSGDGGFNEALNGLKRRLPIGFVAGGRTNVLPRALGVGGSATTTARTVSEALKSGRVREISLGRANGRRFGFSSGIGLDAELIRRWDGLGRRSDGRKPGDLAFMRATVDVLARKRGRIPAQMEVKGIGASAFVLAANCDPYTYLGRLPLHVAPDARFELGFDLVAPRKLNARSIPILLTHLLFGRGQTNNRNIIYRHDLDHVDIACAGLAPLHVDGEDLGDSDHVVFEAERRAVDVLV